MPTDYCSSHLPTLSPSIFISALAYDLVSIYKSLELRKYPKLPHGEHIDLAASKLDSSPEKKLSQVQATLTKEFTNGTAGSMNDVVVNKGKKKQMGEIELIFQNLLEHYKSNLELAEN